MKIIDISWPISTTMTQYKNRGCTAIMPAKSWEYDAVRESVIVLGSHGGTHIDAPAHFIEKGKTIDQISLDHFVGQCRVLDMSRCTERITYKDIEHESIEHGDIVLFKTKNSNHSPDDPFDSAFIFLDASAASWCIERGVKAVGIDYLGIERNQSEHPTHITLLAAHIPIIEGLRLKDVSSGVYTACILPLAVQGIEAAPARAILMHE